LGDSGGEKSFGSGGKAKKAGGRGSDGAGRGNGIGEFKRAKGKDVGR